MNAKQAQAKLAELTAEAECAAEQLQGASDSARSWWVASQDAFAALKTNGKADDAERLRLTHNLLDHIREAGYVFELLDTTRPAAGVRLRNPKLQQNVRAASAHAARTRQKRDSFAVETKHLLDKQRDRDLMECIKDALASDNPAAFKAALAALDTRGPGPLTTHDLPEMKK